MYVTIKVENESKTLEGITKFDMPSIVDHIENMLYETREIIQKRKNIEKAVETGYQMMTQLVPEPKIKHCIIANTDKGLSIKNREGLFEILYHDNL